MGADVVGQTVNLQHVEEGLLLGGHHVDVGATLNMGVAPEVKLQAISQGCKCMHDHIFNG